MPFLMKCWVATIVGELDARAAVGRAARPQLVDGRHDFGFVQARGRRQHQSRSPGVDDDRDLVVLAELFDQALEAPLDQGELVGLLHRAGDVDQEDEVAGRPLGLIDGSGGDADAGQPVLGIPGAAGDLDMHGEGMLARFRGRRVVIGEVIQHLFDAHRVPGRQHVLGEKAADVGIAGGVDVDREGRERLAGRPVERVVDDLVVGLGVRFGHGLGGIS